jgi:SAM-dependent methyltransferase
MQDYIFSSNAEDKELQRLRLIESAVDGISLSAIAQIGVRTGHRCLDVGPGAGSILRWLGGRVGKTGLAMGIDLTARYLTNLAADPYRIIEGDVLSSLPDERFDLIHCRYVLIHNREAARILDALYDRLKPRGHLVLIEPDFTAGRDLVEGSRANPSSAEALRATYCATGKATDADIDEYIGKANDPRRWMVYYTTVSTVAQKPA